MTEADRFHEHLDGCRQCQEHPFSLCSTGVDLLRAAAVAVDQQLADLKKPAAEGEGRT